jgi:GNAT superfamily N-acetyltransferase
MSQPQPASQQPASQPVASQPAVLRVATPADAEACGSVHYASWVETFTGLASPAFWERASRERSIATWRRLLDDGLVATIAEVGQENSREIVGLAIVGESHESGGHPPVRDRELRNLYVLAAHHGTGIGQALLDAVLPPGTPAQLWAAERNPRAARFYERNGFERDGATESGDVFGGIAAIRMVR